MIFPFPVIPGNNNVSFPFPKFGNGISIPVPVPKNWEWNFHSRSRSQKLGMQFIIPVPVPKVWEWAEPFPFPFPNVQKSFPLTTGPGQSDPYILTSLTKSYLWSCDAVRTEREETSASHFQLRKIYLKHLSSWKSDWRQSCSKIDIRWKVGKNFFSAEFNCSDHRKITIFLVESRSWRDWNLKFGPNCDLEVDNFFLKIFHLQITICGPNFKFRSCQLLLSV